MTDQSFTSAWECKRERKELIGERKSLKKGLLRIHPSRGLSTRSSVNSNGGRWERVGIWRLKSWESERGLKSFAEGLDFLSGHSLQTRIERGVFVVREVSDESAAKKQRKKRQRRSESNKR